MTSRPRPTPEQHRLVDRRRFLLGAGLTLALSGCTDQGKRSKSSATHSPTSGRAGPSSTNTPTPGVKQAARTETRLADFAAAIRHQLGGKLSSADKRLLELLTSAHRAHASVLQQSDPSLVQRADNSPSPSNPTTTPHSSESGSPHRLGSHPAKALAKLAALEKTAAGHYRDRALHPDGAGDRLNSLTLLWGSLTVAAGRYAAELDDDHPNKPRAADSHRTNVQLPNRDTAAQHVVGQCDAIIFGLQTALGHLSGTAANRAKSRLAEYRRLRDTARTRLAEHNVTVPEQKPAYRLPTQPTSSHRATKLIVTMEERMLPYLGQWLATADKTSDRKTALTALDTAQTRIDTWSEALHVRTWPGWPTS